MKRIIAILLTAVMLFGMIPLASAEAGMNNFQKTQTYSAGQFADVKTSDWFASGVQSAFELGLMKGSSDSAFKPSGNLTVAEALAIACRLHSIYADNGQTFTQGNPWYQVYVDYAVANKIMTAGQLTPTAQITREQFAYLMCGAIPGIDLNAINTITSIPDESENSTYGSSVYRLYRAGVLTGSDKFGTFKPTTAIQRSEVATIVTRMADKAQRKTVKLETNSQQTTPSNQTTAFDILVQYAKLTPGLFAAEQETESSGVSVNQYSIRYDSTNDVVILTGTKAINSQEPRNFTFELTIPRNVAKIYNGKMDATETNYSDPSRTVNVTGTIQILASKFMLGKGFGYNMSYNSVSGDSLTARSKAALNEIIATSMVTLTEFYYKDMLSAVNDAILKPAGHNLNEFGFKIFG